MMAMIEVSIEQGTIRDLKLKIELITKIPIAYFEL